MAYVIGSGVPYGQYLQGQAYVDDVKETIARSSESSAQQFAAYQESQKANTDSLIATIEQNHEHLSWLLESLSSEICSKVDALNATFEWGFNAILSQTGRMTDSLEALLKEAKTPTKVRAYEFFYDARDAFRRQHYRDALDLIDKAIAGDHTSSGYKLEWRFYFLKSSILVGTVAHPELLDLNAAEETYRTAAEYAKSDNDLHGASLALLGASWACYCQSKLDEALVLAKRALSFQPSFGEALFQTAKILMAMARPDDALPLLSSALEVDPRYLLKASDDGDFQAHKVLVEEWWRKHRDTKEHELRALYADLAEDGRFWTRCRETVVLLKNVETTLLRTNPGLFDLLCALATLRSVESTKALPPKDASDVVRVAEEIPAGLPFPRQLLSNFLIQSRDWRQDLFFYNFAAILLKRSEHEALRELFNNSPRSPNTHLEFFVAWLNALPNDSSSTKALNYMLQQKTADTRKNLVEEIDAVHRQHRYSQDAIKRTKAALISRWEEWLPEINKELKARAFDGTESPYKGLVGRFFGSFFGLMIPGTIVDAIAGHGIGSALWAGGFVLITGVPMMKRSNIRKKKLHLEQEKEKTLYDHLNQIGATANTEL